MRKLGAHHETAPPPIATGSAMAHANARKSSREASLDSASFARFQGLREAHHARSATVSRL